MTVATVGGQQLAGLVDDLGIRVGHVVVIDTDIAGVTLVGKDMLLDIRPGLAVVQLTELALLHVGIALTIDDLEGLTELGGLCFIGRGQL